MKTENETIPPESAVSSGGDSRSISEIVSHLRTAFRQSNFDRAESELVAREVALRREISRLTEANRSAPELRQNLGGEDAKRARDAEERLAKLQERMAAEEREKERVAAENSELRRRAAMAEEKAEEYKKRIAELEVDVVRFSEAEMEKKKKILQKSGAESSYKGSIEISDSDDDCAAEAKSSEREASPKMLKRKRPLSRSVNENKNDLNTGDRIVVNDNMKQEPEVFVTSPAKHATPVKKQASTPTNSSEKQPNAVSKQNLPGLDQADKDSSAKKCFSTHDYKRFWSHFGDMRRTTSPSDHNKEHGSR